MLRNVSLRATLSVCSISALAAGCVIAETETLPGTTTTSTIETMTDTTTTDTTSTTSMTTPGVCGDSVIDEGEECDDGNQAAGDGCSPDCKIVPTPCGNGVLDAGEECDDGNLDATDDCTSSCKHAVCGDGYLHAGVEACDGDGCDASCSTVLPILQVDGYCALLFDGRVKCWGSDLWASLGLGDKELWGDQPGEMGTALPAVNLGTGAVAVELTSGWLHNCARMDDNRLKCWGMNARGACGIQIPNDIYIGDGPGEMGDNLPYVDLGTGRTVVAFGASQHTCAILDDQSLKCWGFNSRGQLGLGDLEDRGDGPGEMGNNLPTVNLGTGRHAVQLALGELHTCALLDDATVKCWGSNFWGQLGLGDKKHRGDEPGEMGDALPTINLGTGAVPVKIAAGGDATCVILDDGRVRCWGVNECNVVGYGGQSVIGDEPSDMGDNMGVVAIGPGVKAVDVKVGEAAACALLTSGEMKCWGCQGNPKLGLADSVPSQWEQSVYLGAGQVPGQIYMDYLRTCAILKNGTLKCWGTNERGQLGLGDTISRGGKAGTMGDNLPIVHVYDDRW